MVISDGSGKHRPFPLRLPLLSHLSCGISPSIHIHIDPELAIDLTVFVPVFPTTHTCVKHELAIDPLVVVCDFLLDLIFVALEIAIEQKRLIATRKYQKQGRIPERTCVLKRLQRLPTESAENDTESRNGLVFSSVCLVKVPKTIPHQQMVAGIRNRAG